MGTRTKEFKCYKKNMIKAAKDLCYGDSVIAKIKAAETENEISMIMRNARIKQEYAELGGSDRWIDRVKIVPRRK